MAISPEEIGKRIRAAREANGWTQLTFALEANVSPATVQRWERGQLPRVRELIRVSGVLGIPAEELVEATPRDEAVGERLARIEQLLEELIARSEPAAPQDRETAHG